MDHGRGGQQLVEARVLACARRPYLAAALFALDLGGGGDPAGEMLSVGSPTRLAACLVHLACHLALDHRGRAARLGVVEAGAARWNLAADLEIDDALVSEGDLDLGGVALPGDFGLPSGWPAEAYYEALAGSDQAPRTSCRAGGGHAEGGGPDDAALRAVGAAVAEAVRREAGAGGRVEGALLREAEAVLGASHVDWQSRLRARLCRSLGVASGAADYTYARTSRRQGVFGDVVVPALLAPRPRVAVVVDTSGSMGQAELHRVLVEVEAICRACSGGEVVVVATDTAARWVGKVTSGREVALAGGGGTDMGAGIVAAAALRPVPQAIVVLTDGMTSWPAKLPPRCAPVIVGLIGARSGSTWPLPAWGTVVDISAPAGAVPLGVAR